LNKTILALFLVFCVFSVCEVVAVEGVNALMVKKWILTALVGKPNVKAQEKEMDKQLTESYALNDVEIGWAALKTCRDAGNSLDLSLAAAEHYLFMRYAASKLGDTGSRRLPQWYETFKKFAVKNKFEEYLKTSDQPLSSINADVTQWGKNGVEAGLIDYKKRESKEPTDKGLTIVTAAVNAFSIYLNKTSGGTCLIKP
jgi:hypothetical protein